jgi:ferredoxin
MAKRIPVVDTEACIACGNCEQVCPEVFRLNEALGYSEVINPTGAPEANIQDAMDQCPA